LPPLIPKSLALLQAAKLSEQRREQLQQMNAALENEIGERKRMEQELRNSEERFRSLFQNLPVGVTLSGPHAEALMGNPASLELLGMTEVPSPCLAAAQQISQAIATRKPVRDAMLAVNRPAHDDVVWLLASSEPQLADDGSVTTVISIFLDVTQRKLAEDSMVEWKNRYEAAIQASGQVLYDWNPATNAVTFGGSLVKTLGYSPEEIEGGLSRWIDLIHPEDRRVFTAEIDRVAATREAVHLHFRMRHKDGAYITVQDDGYFFMAPGNGISRMVGFISNVSERIEIEEQLRQAQKMEAVGQLAGGVAHDFNNILTVIRGYSAMLYEELDPAGGMREDVKEIADAALRATALTGQLLAFSRRQVLEPRALDLNHVLDKLEPMLRRLLGDDIELRTVRASEGLVRSDPVQTELVILNLAINARDAMPTAAY
jgi:two-component system cell cycle sensor histidine kinase/response regulator CckA